MSEAEGWHHHRAFGLNIRSHLALPELLPAERDASVDVDIVYADVPSDLPDALARGVRFQAAKDRLLLIVDGVARYLVEQGRRIAIQRDPAAADDDVRVFLLGPGFGALLHQRDDLVLHASAISYGGGSVAFMGLSGAGKSTLAAAFQKRGHRVLTDDLCVVRPGYGAAMMVQPAFPQAKLWIDSLQELNVAVEGLRRVRSKIEKRAIPLGETFAQDPLTLKCIYLLNPVNRSGLTLVPVQGPAKLEILKRNTYRFRFLASVDDRADHFRHALRLAQQVPLKVIARRESSSFQLDELVALIESDLGGKMEAQTI